MIIVPKWNTDDLLGLHLREVISMASRDADERSVILIADTFHGHKDLKEIDHTLDASVLFASGFRVDFARVREGFDGEDVVFDFAERRDSQLSPLLLTPPSLSTFHNVPMLIDGKFETIDDVALWFNSPNTM